MPYDRSAAVGFGLNPLDRLSEKRADTAFVESARADPAARFLVFVDEAPLFRMDGGLREPFFNADEVQVLGEALHEVLLGEDATRRPLFALALPSGRVEEIVALTGVEPLDVRTIAMRGLVPPELLGELGAAKSILSWHARHRFCANCGAASRMSNAGWRRDCDACGAQHFPRVDPVVIMLAVDGDRCLLGRQPRFGRGMYSALAGFLEPGETIEDAVRREIGEEAGIRCAEVTYFASQPWPFPASLMIGCFARALDTDVVIDTAELEDARWFTRAEVRQMLTGAHPDELTAPMPYAIAHHLIRAFAEDRMPPG
ncbi:NAD(+) diphosphatase [Verticiella sediminum]|uniref:NAD(+) diphosphatase n=1 Tax=Verticiella sediminum TaxID=1247510 RepID=A0A556ARJ3_9BURK|nr:NAD(+) diphosphatase [Verticiella sediminum]TSH95564.1 NAD(+) diphosphatase [Verticiella sediminum]